MVEKLDVSNVTVRDLCTKNMLVKKVDFIIFLIESMHIIFTHFDIQCVSIHGHQMNDSAPTYFKLLCYNDSMWSLRILAAI